MGSGLGAALGYLDQEVVIIFKRHSTHLVHVLAAQAPDIDAHGNEKDNEQHQRKNRECLNAFYPF